MKVDICPTKKEITIRLHYSEVEPIVLAVLSEVFKDILDEEEFEKKERKIHRMEIEVDDEE